MYLRLYLRTCFFQVYLSQYDKPIGSSHLWEFLRLAIRILTNIVLSGQLAARNKYRRNHTRTLMAADEYIRVNIEEACLNLAAIYYFFDIERILLSAT